MPADVRDHRYGVLVDGDRVRGRLHELGITKYRLSRDIDVAPSVVSAWLAGRRNASIGAVVAIADALELTVDEVIGRNTATEAAS